jgi:hypothetical protein
MLECSNAYDVVCHRETANENNNTVQSFAVETIPPL